MEPLECRSTPLEVLATSLVMRLSVDDLQWLGRELAKRAEEKRSGASGVSRLPRRLGTYEATALGSDGPATSTTASMPSPPG